MYRDKNKRQIDKAEWAKLRDQPHYCVIDTFQTNGTRVQLHWMGVDEFGDQHTNPLMYEITVIVVDPTQYVAWKDKAQLLVPSGQQMKFATLEQAEHHFAHFVERHCHAKLLPSGDIDQSLNEWVEPEEWRDLRIQDDPNMPDANAYGSAGLYE